MSLSLPSHRSNSLPQRKSELIGWTNLRFPSRQQPVLIGSHLEELSKHLISLDKLLCENGFLPQSPLVPHSRKGITVPTLGVLDVIAMMNPPFMSSFVHILMPELIALLCSLRFCLPFLRWTHAPFLPMPSHPLCCGGCVVLVASASVPVLSTPQSPIVLPVKIQWVGIHFCTVSIRLLFCGINRSTTFRSVVGNRHLTGHLSSLGFFGILYMKCGRIGYSLSTR